MQRLSGFTSRKPRKAGVSNRSRLFLLSTSIIIVFLLALSAPDCLKANAAEPNTIWGQVTDAITGRPIENATIAVWEFTTIRRVETSTLKNITKTGINGSYQISFEDGIKGRIYAYYDNSTSPGYDYLPKFQNFLLGSGYEQKVNMIFKLVPAASVIFEGDIRFVDFPNPYSSYRFTVVSEKEAPDLAGDILTYGTTTDSHSRFIKVDPNLVIVPANTALRIEVNASTFTSEHTVVIDDPKLASLGKGDKISVKIDKYLLLSNLKFTNDTILLAEKLLNEAEQKDFYVQAERIDLEKTSVLIRTAEEKIVKGLYDESYADLREAYTKIAYTIEKLPLMYAEVQISTTIIIIFLALTSTALSYFFFEHWATKALGIGLFFAPLLALFFYVYAGSRIVDTQSLLIATGLAIFISFIITFIVPRLFPMTATAIFSMAKHNLKKRKVRFILTLVPIIALVMGFVALTSFSTEYGFNSTVIGTAKPQLEGIVIRQPLPETPQITVGTSMVFNFNSLETSVVDWLNEKPEVILSAPKVENYPSRDSVGSLSTSSKQLHIFGILGISPSAEAEATGFNKLLVEGRYLDDGEGDAILISVEAAKALNVQVGESLVLRTLYSSIEVKLVGLLDDHGLNTITDLDGSLVIPKKLVIEIDEEGALLSASIDPCQPSEVVVINWKIAPKLLSFVSYPSWFMSRIDVFVDESVDLLQFTRQIALERNYRVFAAIGGRIHLMELTYYLETKGTSIFIPWLIVILNVIITMINAIYERRKDVAILSSVGLNPTHITSLFGAEASLIGVIGGGIGYLLGLSLYKPMTFLSANISVRQKISAVWSLASLGIAVTAVLIGVLMALRFSVVITPSFLRKFKAKEKRRGDTWIFEIPLKVSQEDIASLLEYIRNRLLGYHAKYDLHVDRTKQVDVETSETIQKSINFTCLRKGIGMESFVCRNEIIASKLKGDENYTLSLTCDISEENKAYLVARFVRFLFIEWTL